MAKLTIPNTITANSNIEAAPIAENFAAVAANSNAELVNRDGTVAMTAELQLKDGNNAASKVYADDAASARFPAGAVAMWAGLGSPAGYLLCDGAAVSRSTYAKLFAAIGTVNGVGNGTTTFNVPNMGGRVPVGYDLSDPQFDQHGETGGSKNAVVVSHSHGDTFTTAMYTKSTNHIHNVNPTRPVTDMENIARVGGFPTSGAAGYLFGNTAGVGRLQVDSTKWNNGNTDLTTYTNGVDVSHSHNINGSVSSAGVSGVNANLQPYLTIKFIIKT